MSRQRERTTTTGAVTYAQAAPAPAPEDPSGVVINDLPLTVQELGVLGGGLAPGSYWYDRRSGLWGIIGRGVQGQTMADLNLGGPLRADASDGGTAVFLNGRELPLPELMWLNQQAAFASGRWWLDSDGAFGREGEPEQGKIRLTPEGGQPPGLSGTLFSVWDWAR